MRDQPWGFRDAPWEPRTPPRFDPSGPASRAFIDVTADLLALRIAGVAISERDGKSWLRALRAAAYQGRTRRRAYDARTAGVGESERLRVTLIGALAYAAVLVELRKAHLRD